MGVVVGEFFEECVDDVAGEAVEGGEVDDSVEVFVDVFDGSAH